MPVLKKRSATLNQHVNGLYVHFSPPRVLNLSSADIRQLIKLGDVNKLEQVVLEGQGKKLIGEYSPDFKLRTFIKSVPTLISKISLLHDAVNSGRLQELQTLLNEEPAELQKKLVMAKDDTGVGLLHKAVYHNLKDIYAFLLDNFPHVVNLKDAEGRTAYHYTAMCRDPKYVQKLLIDAGADQSIVDNRQHSARYYMEHRQELELPNPNKISSGSLKSPSKDGLVIKKSNIRIWIHQRNLENLQKVVWEGHGSQLLVEHSNNARVRKFLEAVPHIMGLIKDVHCDVQNNDLESLRTRTSPPVLPVVLSGKDANGLTPLHKAAGLGHQEIAEYIVAKYPEVVNAKDTMGRTPLHYAALLKEDGSKMWEFLISSGVDESALDDRQKSAGYYKTTKNSEIDPKLLQVVPDSPRTAKESFIATWDWNFLTAVTPTEEIMKAVKPFFGSLPEKVGKIVEEKVKGVFDVNENERAKPAKKEDKERLNNHKNSLDEDEKKANNSVRERNEKNIIKKDLKPFDATVGNKIVEEELEDEDPAENRAKTRPSSENRGSFEDDRNESKSPNSKPKSRGHSTKEREDNDNHEEERNDAKTPRSRSRSTKREDNANERNKSTSPDSKPKSRSNQERSESRSPDSKPKSREASTKEREVHDNLDGGERNESKSPDSKPKSRGPSTKEHERNFIGGERNEFSPDSKPKSRGPSTKEHERNFNGGERNEFSPDSKPKSRGLSTKEREGTFNGEERNEYSPDSKPKSRGPSTKERENTFNGEERNEYSPDSKPKTRGRDESSPEMKPKSRGPSSKDRNDNDSGEDIRSPRKPHSNPKSRGNSTKDRPHTNEEGVIEGIVNGENEVETLNEEGQGGTNDGGPDEQEISEMVASGNMEQLAAVVLNGDGDRLAGHQSDNPELQTFLDNVPVYMSKIKRIHVAAKEGSLRDLQAALDRRKFAIAKDKTSPNGASPLHVSTVFGNTSIVRYLAGRFPETLQAVDDNGRTPLHYAAVLADNGHYYNLLLHLGADARTEDKFGHTPDYYKTNRTLISHAQLLRELGADEQQVDEILCDKVPDDTSSARKDLDDEDMISVLERCYNVLHGRRASNAISAASTTTNSSMVSNNPYSMLGKHMKRYVFDGIKLRMTKTDHNLYDLIWPSVKKLPNDVNLKSALDQDFSTGVVIPDFDVFKVFHEFLVPFVKDINCIDINMELQTHPGVKFLGDPEGDEVVVFNADVDLDPHAKNIISGSSGGGGSQVDMPFFRTEEGRYLASSLGDPLIKGLTEVANKRPEDPIAYLAKYLADFANNTNKPRSAVKSRGKTQESMKLVTGPPQTADNNASVPQTIDVVTVAPEGATGEQESAFSSTSRDEHGQSMLHFASARSHGRNALFQLLMETEINLGYRDELYRTARDISIQANLPENTTEIDKYVMQIAMTGDIDKLVELLLEGYDHIIDVVDEDDAPIVDAVAKAGQPDTVAFLQSILAFEEKRERVHHAIRQNALADVKNLLADKNDTGSGKLLAIGKNSYGRCTLHIAVLCQQEEIVDFLANTFPDTLHVGDNLERTALHYAMGVEKIETLSKVLIKSGAQRVTKDLKGRQPTYYFMNKSDILRLQEEEETF